MTNKVLFVDVLFIELDGTVTTDEEDQFFELFVRALIAECSLDETKKRQLEKISSLLRKNVKRLLFNKKICVPT